MIRYAKRENAFEKAERVWTVEPDALVWSGIDGTYARIPWTDVVAVRLVYAPTSLKTWRHKLTLKGRNGATWIIDNAHFKGVGEFEDRSAAFSPFAMACIERIAAAAPAARAALGSDPMAYWTQLAFVAAMVTLLAVVIILLPTPFGALIWIKLALIAAMLPAMARFVIRSWPRTVPLDPEAFRAALPQGSQTLGSGTA